MDVEGEEAKTGSASKRRGAGSGGGHGEKCRKMRKVQGVYRGLTAGEYSRMPVGRKSRRPAYAATVLLGRLCVFGVTAYLNHEKMVDMEQTLAQMKGTRYVTEAQTADTETEETERMPSVAVETVMGNVEKQELSAEAAGTQEDSAAQQAETAQEAQGAQGTARASGKCNGKCSRNCSGIGKLQGDTAAAGGQACADAAGTSVEAQTQSTPSTDGDPAAVQTGHDDSCRKLIGGECRRQQGADRGADVSVAGIL